MSHRSFFTGLSRLAQVIISLLVAANNLAWADSQIVGPFNGRYYQLVEDTAGINWQQARDLASTRMANGFPGYLATITTVEEHTFIVNSLPQFEYEQTWLGATDDEFEGWFKWYTGESAQYGIGRAGMYGSWASGQPDGGLGENCIASRGAFSAWNDLDCTQTLNFILVEYSAPILETKYCYGRSGQRPLPDPNAYAIIPRLGYIPDPGCEADTQDTLFEDRLVPLANVPVYLRSTAANDPNFADFVTRVTAGPFCLEITQSLIDVNGDLISFGSGCGSRVETLEGEQVEQVELLVGDETRVEYDPVQNMLNHYQDYTVNFYGPAPSRIEVDINIKPGNKRNRINPRKRGNVWVAILSDTSPDSPFDPASQVDIPTVDFGPDGAKANRYKVKDVNKDRIGDLLLRFKVHKAGISCEDADVTLTGETIDGPSFTGTDSIKTVGCKPKKRKNKHHHSHDFDDDKDDCDDDKKHQGN